MTLQQHCYTISEASLLAAPGDDHDQNDPRKRSVRYLCYPRLGRRSVSSSQGSAYVNFQWHDMKQDYFGRSENFQIVHGRQSLHLCALQRAKNTKSTKQEATTACQGMCKATTSAPATVDRIIEVLSPCACEFNSSDTLLRRK